MFYHQNFKKNDHKEPIYSQFQKNAIIMYIGLLGTPIDNEWLSCKILQNSGKILQEDPSSCKIFFQNLARSCKITLRLARILQDNHSSCKYANKWNMTEQDPNETRTLLPINFFYIVVHNYNQIASTLFSSAQNKIE